MTLEKKTGEWTLQIKEGEHTVALKTFSASNLEEAKTIAKDYVDNLKA